MIKVRVVDLKGSPELSGRLGNVVSYSWAPDRFGVELFVAGKLVATAIREANLVRVD